MSLRELMGEAGEYYPGSKERRQVNHMPDDVPDAPELGSGRVLLVRGFEVEFFGIGDLARALNRQPVTIRAWEREGILPPPTFTKPGRDRDPRGRRRLYTRAQVVGTWLIAREEGVLDPGPRINILKTQFTRRVTALFDQLKKEGLR